MKSCAQLWSRNINGKGKKEGRSELGAGAARPGLHSVPGRDVVSLLTIVTQGWEVKSYDPMRQHSYNAVWQLGVQYQGFSWWNINIYSDGRWKPDTGCYMGMSSFVESRLEVR